MIASHLSVTSSFITATPGTNYPGINIDSGVTFVLHW